MAETNEGRRVYELGYHIISSVAEENVGVEVETLKSLISKHGGEMIAEGAPELTELAYEIRKRFESGYQTFDRAYFGWIKFELDAEKLAELQDNVDDVESVLRYIIVKTVRENTIYGPEVLKAIKAEEAEDEDTGDVPEKQEAPKTKTAKEEKEEKGEVVEEELDEKLDELVSDDKVEE